MIHPMKQFSSLFAVAASLAVLGACASSMPTAVPADYMQGTALDRHDINVVKRTEFLEIPIVGQANELSDKDRLRIRDFVSVYTKRGHGPLVLSLPQVSVNPQLAVSATAEARAIAWEMGVEYDEISGTAHGAGSSVSEPMILAFQVYEAIPPHCQQKSELDFSNIDSNNHLPTLGCSVRTNLAAMIVDPGDLLGQRALGQADVLRREIILDKFREGTTTASERSAQESGAVSSAVN